MTITRNKDTTSTPPANHIAAPQRTSRNENLRHAGWKILPNIKSVFVNAKRSLRTPLFSTKRVSHNVCEQQEPPTQAQSQINPTERQLNFYESVSCSDSEDVIFKKLLEQLPIEKAFILSARNRHWQITAHTSDINLSTASAPNNNIQQYTAPFDLKALPMSITEPCHITDSEGNAWTLRPIVTPDPSHTAQDHAATLLIPRQDFEDTATKSFTEKLISAGNKALRESALWHMQHTQAHTDPLTNLGNRRAYDEWFNKTKALPEQPIIWMLDLNHLKRHNAQSHQAGDSALIHVADAIKRHLQNNTDKSNRIATRWGGDEFAVGSTNTSLAEEVDTAEWICADIRATQPVQVELPITVTIGIAQPSINSLATARTLFDTADQLMLDSKKENQGNIITIAFNERWQAVTDLVGIPDQVSLLLAERRAWDLLDAVFSQKSETETQAIVNTLLNENHENTTSPNKDEPETASQRVLSNILKTPQWQIF